MSCCLLALGSNLGDRAAMLREAVSAVATLPGCQVIARSRWHETAPVGGPEGQGAFLNGALLLETQVAPQELCSALLQIEARLGRERAVRWDARAIDIDMLLYGEEIIATSELVVPHPRMSCRRFVLEPAAEIAGAMIHATSGWTIAGLLAHLHTAPRYVAVISADTTIADWLADQLATELNCPRLEETRQNRAAKVAGAEAGAVESVKDAVDLLRRSHWLSDPVLEARLSGRQCQDGRSVRPVISGFWKEALAMASGNNVGSLDYLIDEGGVTPALVIAIEPTSGKEFSKNIFGENYQKNLVLPNMSCQKFGEFLDRHGHIPMARIQTDQPAVVIQEALAAIGSAWS